MSSVITKMSPVVILGLSIYGCSILGPSYQENIARKVAGVVNQGDFVINRCRPLAGEKSVKAECLQSEFKFGDGQRSGCGVPRPAYVVGAEKNNNFLVLALSGNDNVDEPVSLPGSCLSPYVNDERVIHEKLNLALSVPRSKKELILIGEDKKTKYQVCGMGVSSGLALVAEFPTSCGSKNAKVVSLKSMRAVVQNSKDFSPGTLVSIVKESKNKICGEAQIVEIHQVFSQKLESHFEAKLKCLGRETASEKLSHWVALNDLALK